MRLQDHNDYTTLTWVKPEIDETLKLARQGLEAYVEQGEDPAQLALCVEGLAQVHGALRMVELYGAAMVAEEMHALANALAAGSVQDRDGGFTALMRGIVQLPDYLERLQSGLRDIPLVLLPLLNDLRGARGEKGVSESMLFSPNLALPLPEQARAPISPPPQDEVKRRALVASQLFQGALLRWLKDGDALWASDLADVCLQLVDFTSAESARRLFWIASALLDAAARGAFPFDRVHQQALAKVEREIKRLATEGDEAFSAQPPVELTRQLLYFAANAPAPNGRLAEVVDAFQLASYAPTEREVEHARSAMAGHNRALLSTVSDAIKEDLLRVKDALDLHMRAPAGVVAEVDAQIETLDRVKETLGVLGLGVPQRVVRDQLVTLRAFAGGQRVPDESTLLDIAGALLYVEAMLDDQVVRLGGGGGDDGPEQSSPQPLLPAAEARAVLDVVSREALNNFAAARSCFVAFVETHWDHSRLQDVAPLLIEVVGALRILEVPSAGDLLTAISRYTQEELISKRRVPNGQQLDRLADALASVEYFLEAVRDRRPNADQILAIARDSLTAIGYWPLPEGSAYEPAAPKPFAPAAAVDHRPVEREVVQPAAAVRTEVVAQPSTEAAAIADSEPLAEAEVPQVPLSASTSLPPLAQPSPLPSPSSLTVAAPAGQRLVGYEAASSDDFDAEIQEVFLEEFTEEIENLGQLLPAWRARLDQPDVLRPIRRVFHTLKGSGRLVGAKELGEFSWAFESMLNRVLDGTRPASLSVFDAVAAATAVLPELRGALAGETRYADLEGLMELAKRVAGGEDAAYVPPQPPEDREPVPVDDVPAAPAPVGPDAEPANEDAEGLTYADTAAAPPVRWALLPEFTAVPDPLVFALDSVLLEILRPEVEGHLGVVEAWLSAVVMQPEAPLEEPLLRSVHTMNGAFAMTEVSAITAVTAPLESFFKRAMAAGHQPGTDETMLVRQATLAVRQTLDALSESEARLPQFPALANALRAACDQLPDAVVPSPLLVEHFDLVPVDMGDADASQVPMFDKATGATPAAIDEDDAFTAPAGDEISEADAAHALLQQELAGAAHREAVEREASQRAEQEAAELAAREAAAFAQMQAELVGVALQEASAKAEREEQQRAERERVAAEVARREQALREAEAAFPRSDAAPERRFDPSEVPDAGDRTDPDEALDVTDIDVDLLEIFLEEAGDLLDHSDGLMARLRDGDDDPELVVGLQRDLHTLKGGARMAGVWPVGELGHAVESLLEAVADGKRGLDGPSVVVLERSFDRLQVMVERLSARRAIGQPDRLIAQIDALAEGLPLPDAAVETDAAASDRAAAPAPPFTAARKPGLAALSTPIDDSFDDDEGGALRASQEQVRIRADLLDQLVNYAGEVAIYRARLEQQLGAFRGNLNELEQTTSRIRDQLRRLEIETEAQIASRYQREEVASKTFDPLELDRFSNQQQLTRSLAESTNDLSNLYDSLDDLTRGYEALLLQQSRVSSELQEGLMRTRMLPFESLVPRLRRVLRQACTDTGKQAQLKVDGAGGEMDRSVLDRMTAPIEHMLRNSVAHGLELPDERRKAGKGEEGTVRIGVAREGSEVVLRVTDDGRGLDRDRIFAKAVERGLVDAGATLSDEQVFGFILEAGFSTADSVSKLAGRGVGMDVVYSEIRQLGGSLQIRSDAGKGSEFTVRLPFTLAVTQAVFVKIGETRFAVPIASVQGVSRIGREALQAKADDALPGVRYAGEDYAVYDLGRLVGQAPAKAEGSLQMPVLLARSGELRAAICVDQVLGSREIVVKPVGPQVGSISGIFGATIMGDGSVVVILDVAPLARRYQALAIEHEDAPAAPAAAPLAERKVPYVMVVDDSVTMRKVTGRVLERHSFEVGTAKDGVDAIEKMAERVPDLMLLDIEMPRMDGYELAQTMRGDPRLRDVPIIMITSRTGDKHRQRAFEIGVNRYLGKPYQEPELVRHVFELLAEVAARD